MMQQIRGPIGSANIQPLRLLSPIQSPIEFRPITEPTRPGPLLTLPSRTSQPIQIRQLPSNQPVTVQQGTIQPVTIRPSIQPATKPVIIQPGTVRPSIQPVIVQPGTVRPSIQPTVVQPGTVRPSIQPTIIQPGTVRPSIQPVTQPTIIQPITIQPSGQPFVAGPPRQPSIQLIPTRPPIIQPIAIPLTEGPSPKPISKLIIRPLIQPSTIEEVSEVVTIPPSQELISPQLTLPQLEITEIGLPSKFLNGAWQDGGIAGCDTMESRLFFEARGTSSTTSCEKIESYKPIISQNQPIIEIKDENIIELADLVYSYPDIRDPDFQGKIGRKLEFAELSTTGKEPTPERGEFFSHQTYNHRFFQIYDRALVVHPTGSGKTGTASGTTEQFKRNFLEGALNYSEQYLTNRRNQIRRAYILVPGPVIKDEFRNQIIRRFSKPGDYDTEYLKEAHNEATVQRRITKLLGTFYSIMTYSAFVKEVYTLTPQLDNDLIQEKYSGVLFVIDEGHNFILQTEEDIGNLEEDVFRKLSKIGEIRARKRMEGKQGRSKGKQEKRAKGEEGSFKDKDIIYYIVQRVFKIVKRSKIMILAATPMINQPEDLTYIMNLIIPEGERQMNPSTKLIDMPDEELSSFLRGRISYVPDLDTNVDVVYEGTSLQEILSASDPNGILFKGRFYPYRSIVYYSIMEASPQPEIELWQDDGYQMSKLTKSKWRWDQRQASSFVFPDGSYGQPGFAKYIDKERKRYRPRPDTNLLSWLPVEWLRYRSSKYAVSIPLIISNQGKVFCYSDSLKGSGIIVFGLALEANGFEKFDRNEGVFITDTIEESSAVGIKDINGNWVPRKMNIEPRLRYAMLTGEMHDKQRNVILNLFNSWENRHGDYIKVILTSPVAQFGLNVADVTMIMILEPGWHQAGRHQASSRPLRAVSHVFLLEEERERLYKRYLPDLLNQGLDPIQANLTARNKAKADARITVKIYQHAAVSLKTSDSVEIRLYKQSEEKAIDIDYIFNKLKSNSIDCLTHRFRKKRAGSTNRIEYFDSDYSCLTNVTEPIDVSSYDVLYSEGRVLEAINFLQTVFSRGSSYRLTDLYEMFLDYGLSQPMNPDLPDFRPLFYRAKFVLMAAERIISNKYPLIDRFGFISYLVENNGYLFLTKEYPLSSDTFRLTSTYYVENLFGLLQRDLDDYINSIQRSSQEVVIDDIKEIIPTETNKTDILNLINSLNNTSKVDLLEWAVINQSAPISSIIINRFIFNLYGYYDPEVLVRRVEQKLLSRGQNGKRGRGRPPNPGSEPRMTFTDNDFLNLANTTTNEVFFHNLADQDKDEAVYRTSSKFLTGKGHIRIYRTVEGEWRDVTISEKPVYTDLAEFLQRTVKLAQVNQHKVYGNIMNDGLFRIVNTIGFEEQLTRPKRDKRREPRGKVCTSYKISELVYFLYYEGAQPPMNIDTSSVDINKAIMTLKANKFTDSKITKNKIDEILADPNQGPKAILDIYSWYKYLEQIGERQQKAPLCRELEQVFRENGKIINSSNKL